MENNYSLFLKLDKLCCNLDKQYNINSGYCYYVAYLIAKFCEKNNIDYQFVAYKEPHGGESTIYHYAVQVDNIVINQDRSDTLYFELQYINQDSKWMYQQHKKHYRPKLSYYWKDYYKRFVNKELKKFFLENSLA